MRHDRELGAHPWGGDDPRGVGASFAVLAPAATAVAVVGDWNGWDGRAHPMAPDADGSGVWRVDAGGAEVGHRYRFAITAPDGTTIERADPVAFRAEAAPGTSSIVHRSAHEWGDGAWRARRADAAALGSAAPATPPLSIYEVHVGSWRADVRGYRDLAATLPGYVAELGFSHVELLPVTAHPFGGSWGYQTTSYFAPEARWGDPDDLKHLIDALHAVEVGVILDWVPAHFPKDPWALARFDGTALYEHPDPRRAEHPDWGTLEFDLGRAEVQDFLISSACWWLDEYHADGLRVDAVASMLYLDYSRAPGEWEPNEHGGAEDLEAVAFIRRLTDAVHAEHPGALVVAEESTAWPGVTSAPADGGLGFDRKWDLGWMHDTLGYLGKEAVHRRYHQHQLTFGMHYAGSERFVLPLSHDEVVHGKGSLLRKLPGDRSAQLATLRALYGWMWAHPGDQLLFMGGEIGQDREWDHDGSVQWELLELDGHRGVQALVRQLHACQRTRPALWAPASVAGTAAWLVDDADANVAVLARRSAQHPEQELVVCAANFSPLVRTVDVPWPMVGPWEVVVDTDDVAFGGVGATARPPIDGPLELAPLSVCWLEPGGVGDGPSGRAAGAG